MQLLKLLVCIAIGFILARLTGAEGIHSAAWYMPAVTLLLAIGLYASTYSINLQEARQHLKTIVAAVTVGVILKAALIGGSLALLFHDPFFLILGVAVAQIDPLSIASLMKDDRMSKKAKAILASWASFDDPVTVLLSLYIPVVVGRLTTLTTSTSSISEGGSYAVNAGLNVLLAGGAFLAWRFLRNFTKQTGMLALLATVFAVAVSYFLMLAVALVGLFLRPPKIAAIIEKTVTVAFGAAAILIGLLLVNGIELWKGIALGVAAYFAQVIVGFMLTSGLSKKDRWHISFAQQNGITAIILALLFEPLHPGTIAIIVPAIITINSLHGIINKLIDVHTPWRLFDT